MKGTTKEMAEMKSLLKSVTEQHKETQKKARALEIAVQEVAAAYKAKLGSIGDALETCHDEGCPAMTVFAKPGLCTCCLAPALALLEG